MFLAIKQECEDFCLTTTTEVSDDEQLPAKRNIKRKRFPDFVSGMSLIKKIMILYFYDIWPRENSFREIYLFKNYLTRNSPHVASNPPLCIVIFCLV